MIEFFCGIGGARAAAGTSHPVTHAFDQNDVALSVYRLNESQASNSPKSTAIVSAKNIEQLTAQEFRALPGGEPSGLWWMSPPCQPYTVQGARKDWDDPRAKSFRHVLEHLHLNPPQNLALENVVGFKLSRARIQLLNKLRELGYRWQEITLCPTELGIPNRRPRYYLAGSREREPEIVIPKNTPRPLVDFLDSEISDTSPLWIDPSDVEKYRRTLPIVTREETQDPAQHANCFTSGYGRAFSRSGSYLLDAKGVRVRRFSPHEIARLLGFGSFGGQGKGSPGLRFPGELSLTQQWKLVGNSLSVPAVKTVLTSLGFS